MLNALAFVAMFVIGGLSGIFMASTAGRHAHPRHLLHRRPHPLRAVRRHRCSASSPAIYFWYPKMFGRMMNETLGKIHWCAHVRLLQLRLLPDAHPGHGRHAAAHLRLHAVHAPEGPAADEPVHDDRAVRARARRRSSSSLNFFLSMRRGQARGPEPLAREHARVADDVAAARTRTSPGACRPSTAGPYEYSVPGPRLRLLAAERARRGRRPRSAWLRRPLRTTGAATRARGLHRFAVFTRRARRCCLIVAGGLVTSTESGLSVPDWPTTYGQNMFTFPVSKWVGGIRYEHVHRLVASGVGLLTVVLAVLAGAPGAAALGPPPRLRRARARSSPRESSAG